MNPSLLLTRLRLLCVFVPWLLLAGSAAAAQGSLLGITVAPFPGGGDGANDVVVQADGKPIAVGYAEIGAPQFALTRFNADGSLDTSYGTSHNGTELLPVGSGGSQAFAAAMQADGKVVAVGQAQTDLQYSTFAIARFNADGTPDASFGSGGAVVTPIQGSSSARAVALQADGKIVAAGYSAPGSFPTGSTGYRVFTLARYNPDGSLDTSFGSQGVVVFPTGPDAESILSLAICADGSIIVAGNGTSYVRYARVTSAGTIDATYAGSGNATIAGMLSYGGSQQADGKVLLTGNYNNRLVVVRLNTDGTLDSTFGTAGMATWIYGNPSSPYSGGTRVIAMADGRIVASGVQYYQGTDFVVMVRFNADGTNDAYFGTPESGFSGNVFGLALRPGGGFVAVGQKTSTADSFVIAYDANGVADTSFAVSGYRQLDLGAGVGWTYASAQQADGKIVQAGINLGTTSSTVVRYNADGSLDTAFGANGYAATKLMYHTNAVAIAGDGRIVTAGDGVMRFNADGSIDTSFGNMGFASIPSGWTLYAVAVQGDGRIVAAGRYALGSLWNSAILRLTASGVLDTTFGGNGSVVLSASPLDQLNAIALQSDGKIVAAGWNQIGVTQNNIAGAQNLMEVVRMSSDGILDTGFGTSGIASIAFGSQSASAAALAIQGDGRIVVGGSVVNAAGGGDFALARLTAAGALDATFGNSGVVQTDVGDDDELRALALLADGKITAAGRSGALVGLGQYLSNGALDTTFGSAGVVHKQIFYPAKFLNNDAATGISIATDGTLYVGATAAGSMFALARFSGEADTATLATATVTATASPNPTTVRQPLTVTATVSGAVGTPTGTVDFVFDGGKAFEPCARVTIVDGTASCSGLSSPPSGTHSIVAIYSGDATYYAASSAPVSETVNKVASTVMLSSTSNPSNAGASVSFTATVSGNAGTATGTVTFNDGATVLCGGISFSSGSATCTTSALAVGTHTITATYSGNSSYLGQTSAPLSQTVQATYINQALAANGGVALSSSQYGAGFPVAAINNGDATGANWSNGGGWADSTVNLYPDWVEIDFNGPKLIDKVVVYTLQDNWQSPSQPTDGMTFTQYGIQDFGIEAWDGSQWRSIAGVVNNNLVKQLFSFNAVNTTKIRVVVTKAMNSLSRITEVEAWGSTGTPLPTPSSMNVAFVSNGGTAIASSQYNSKFPVYAVTDGDESGMFWSNGTGWADGTLNQYPDWVEVHFAQPSQIDHVVLVTLQDNWQNPVQPTDTMTFTQYGVTAFDVQAWDGSTWQTVGSVTNNNLVKRTVWFNAVTTSKIRIVVNAALNGLSRIVEIEAWTGNGTGGESNVALASVGAAASASSQYNASFPVSAINNGDRAGVNWANGGGWADGTIGQYPDWVQIDFNGWQSIDKVVLYTVQDNWQNPVDPSDTLMFTQYGITDFTVQGWDGAGWVTLATVSGNNFVKRSVSFTPFTTNKIRINVLASLNGLSRITEVEAWGTAASPPPVPVGANYALASSGASASASSQYSASFPAAAAIDGDTAGTSWGAGGGWADGTVGQFPDWLQVNFLGTKTIYEVDVFTLQDNWQSPSTPTATMTFSQYGVTDFEVQGWNGTQWVTLGTVSNNNLVKRAVTFAPFNTDRIRINVTGALSSLSRIAEVQAWGSN